MLAVREPGPSILLVEDDPIDREAFVRHVQRHHLPYRVTSVDSVDAAREVIGREAFDVGLLDYELAGDNAFEIVSVLGDVPCIIVTGRGGEEVAGEALRQGAYDYLVKDAERHYLDRLPNSIHTVLARKRAELALRESEARYQDLFDNAPDIYFEIAHDGTVLSINRRGATQLGYDVSDLVGAAIWKVVHPQDVENVKVQIRLLADQWGGRHRIIFREIARDGGVLHVDGSITVARGPEGELSFRIICRDVTATVEAESRARQLQERLVRSERMEALGVLAGGVAHDLNNILGPMVAYPDLLMTECEPGGRTHRILEQIKNSSMRAASVVKDLLTMARRGRQPTEVVALSAVLDAYFGSTDFKDLVDTRPNVVTEVKVARSLPPVLAAEASLLKAVMNLVMNAFEAMPHGGVLTLAARAERLATSKLGFENIPAGDYVVIEVADTGAGIREEDRDRIFEPFFTKKRLGRCGSGLGLSVVYGVLKDHGGHVDLWSQVGVGTRFSLYLPCAEGEVAATEQHETRSLIGSERILVVDDEPEQREIAALVLKEFGYDVSTVSSGTEAVEIFKRNFEAGGGDGASPFDLILLDMIMEEGCDGLDTYSAIVSMVPKQKCLIVSGFAETGRVKRAQELGAGKCLAKPYTASTLGAAVRGELDRV
jgi:PAS domain S-box-containing protein